MLTTEFVDRLEQLRHLGQANGGLFDILDEWQGFSVKIQDAAALIALSDDNQAVINRARDHRKRCVEFVEDIKATKSRFVFSEVDVIKKKIDSFATVPELSLTYQYIEEIKRSLDVFADKYDELVRAGYPHDQVCVFARIVSDLFLQLLDLRQLSLVCQSMLNVGNEVGESDLIPFDLTLESTQTLSTVVRKLAAFEVVVSEVLEICGSDSPRPVLYKVETGSLNIRIGLSGECFAVLERVISNVVAYFHRRWTVEGKLGAMPKKVETVEAVLGLRESLRAVGIETDEMDEHIVKASVKIAAAMNDLVVGETSVRAGNRKLELDHSMRQEMLDAMSQHLLSSGHDDSDGIGRRADTE